MNEPNKFLVYGRAKSGTTALAHGIAQGLSNSLLLFEPQGRRRDEEPRGRFIVTKELLGQTWRQRIQEYHDYDRKVLLVRDPRDRLVSEFLWRLADGNKKGNGGIGFEEAIALIQAKEIEKNSISFADLCRSTGMPLGSIKERFLRECLGELDKSWFIMKYEQMVDGNLQPLADYLGFMPIRDPDINKPFARRTARTKSHGDWRKWFTEADVASFSLLANPVLVELGYDANDWLLSEQGPDSEFGSEYLSRIYIQKNDRHKRGE